MRLAALALASSFVLGIPSGLRGRQVDRLPTKRHEVALTIDAGGDPRGGWSIVRTLLRRHVPATFFLSGRFVRANPALARAIGSHFVVGNHTWSHPYMTRLSSTAVSLEIRRGAQAVRRATGQDPHPLFRFPYGDADRRTIAIANGLGYVAVGWTVDSAGWLPGQTVAAAVRRVSSGLRPGAIVLMHIGAPVDTRALPGVLDAIQRRGYSFTTLAGLGAR
jgi:peptidoglycan/xylan/chitin deacetylase (PgdA/CDA1 family)